MARPSQQNISLPGQAAAIRPNAKITTGPKVTDSQKDTDTAISERVRASKVCSTPKEYFLIVTDSKLYINGIIIQDHSITGA